MSFVLIGCRMALLLLTRDMQSILLAETLAFEAESAGIQTLNLPEEEVAVRFGDHESDLALINPLVYARNQSECSILSGAAISSVGPTGEILLYFNEGLHHFETVGCEDVSSLEAMLAAVILRERYNMTPKFGEFHGTVDEGLQRFDAVVFVRNTESETVNDVHVIDLVDEWYDMTQLPFVRSLLIGWTHRVSERMDAHVRSAGQSADSRALRALEESMKGTMTPDALHSIPGHWRFLFDEDAQEGLNQFFRYAFYYGLHRDIPLLNIWKFGEMPLQ